VSDVFKRSYPSWTVGVRFSLPIFLRHGRGERDRLRGETDQAEQQLIAVKRSVEEQVYNRYQELDHARRRLEAARSGVTASHEQVRIGGLEYSVGRTTAFELVRLGADLASAQQRYSQALVRAAKASAELRRLLAGSLDQETRKL
jgi:outer membrane protein TolC